MKSVTIRLSEREIRAIIEAGMSDWEKQRFLAKSQSPVLTERIHRAVLNKFSDMRAKFTEERMVTLMLKKFLCSDEWAWTPFDEEMKAVSESYQKILAEIRVRKGVAFQKLFQAKLDFAGIKRYRANAWLGFEEVKGDD